MARRFGRSQPLPLGARDGVDPKLVAAIDRLGHVMRIQMSRVARAHGLTPTQLQLLLRLRTDPPERNRASTLAAELDLTVATVSDTLTTLERKGLVERAADPEDGRGVRITLTLHGEDIARSADAWQSRAQDLLARVSESDKLRALDFLVGVLGELHSEGLVAVAPRICPTCRYHREPDEVEHDDGRCVLLDLDLGPGDVRVDCPEHESVPRTEIGRRP